MVPSQFECQVATMSDKPARLESLDVFRGLTIAGMVIVNNPGTWGAMYPPLKHAQWDGCTPTDLIFPFFLFIVGVAMTFSFDRRLARGDNKWDLLAGVAKRALLLIALGLALTGFPNLRLIGPFLLGIAGLSLMFRVEPVWVVPKDQREKLLKMVGYALAAIGLLWFVVDLGHFKGPNKVGDWSAIFPMAPVEGGSYIRIPGVLQRIGFTFFLASLIAMMCGTRGRIAWIVGLLLGYWALLRFVQAPDGYAIGDGGGRMGAPTDAPFPGTLNDWFDVRVLKAHLYSERPDPEGLLSSIPSVATILLGMLTGRWLQSSASPARKCSMMLLAAVPFLVIGLLWDQVFPLNKKIWSSSFVLYTTGWGLLTLGACYWLNDVRGYRAWSKPLLIFGTNPILVFFGSGLMARLLGMIKWTGVDGKPISIKGWLYPNAFESWLGAGMNASLAFSVAFLVVWLVIAYPLYRYRIFLKV